MYPEEVCALVLKYMIDLAIEKTKNKKIDQIVFCVPSEFRDKQRNLMKFILKLACSEFELHTNQMYIINESTASIFQYKKMRKDKGKEQLKEKEKIVVINFEDVLNIDCFICEKEDTKMMAFGADPNLGKNDFINMLCEVIKEKMINEGIVDDDYFNEPKGKHVEESQIKEYKQRRKSSAAHKI